MIFAHPWMLLWALLAVPLMLAGAHRRRTLVVTDLALWDEAIAERTPLDRWGATLARLLAGAAMISLALALARPVWPAPADAAVVLIVDVSASMSAGDGRQSRLDLARERTRDTIEHLPTAYRATLISASAVTRVLSGWTDDVAQLQTAVEQITPTEAAGDLDEALDLAADLTSDKPNARIIVFTDLAGRNAGRRLGNRSTGRSPRVEWVVCGDGVENAGITACQFRPSPIDARAGDVLVSLSNAGRRPQSVTLERCWEGESTPASRTSLQLAPGAVIEHIEHLADSPGGLLTFRLIESDALAADNRATIIIPPLSGPRVVVAAGASRAVRVAVESLQQFHITTAEEKIDSLGDSSGTNRLVVFDRATPPRLPDGPCLVFGPAGDCDLWRCQGSISRDVEATDSPTDGPLPDSDAFSSAVIEDLVRLEFTRPARTLVAAKSGDAIVSLVERPAGGVLVLHAPLDKTDFAARSLLPMFVLDSLQLLGVWDREYRPAPTTADVIAIAPADAPRELVADDGRRLPAPARSTRVGPLEHGGVWRLGQVGQGPLGPLVLTAQLSSPGETAVNGLDWSLSESRQSPPSSPASVVFEAPKFPIYGPWWRCCAAVGLGCLLLAYVLGRSRPIAAANPSRRWIALLVAPRVLVAACLVAALFAPTHRRVSRETFVVLAVDRSASIRGPASQRAADFVTRVLERQPADRVAVVAFAGRAALEGPQALLGNSRLQPMASDPGRALELAAVSCPPGFVPRLALVSDGSQTAGDALKAVAGWARPVAVAPLETWAGPEVCVADVTASEPIVSDDTIAATIAIDSNHPDSGALRLYCDDRLAEESKVSLSRGRTLLRKRVALAGAARATIRAELTGAADGVAENNRRSTIVHCPERPRALVVSGDAASGEWLAGVLRSHRFETRAIAPASLPADADAPGWGSLDLVALGDVDSRAMSEAQWDAIERYVRQGGGLVATGGEHVFSRDAYLHSRLESLLPLAAMPEQSRPAPNMALVLVIDTSGSMGDGGRLEMAQQAARDVIDLVTPADSLGLYSFSSAGQWVVPLARVGDKGALRERIDSLTARGGTNMFPALERAWLALSESASDRKHLVLLTDGVSVPGDFQALAHTLARDEITLSAVSIGVDVDERLLKDMTRAAHGRYYHCSDPAAVPRVLVADARAVAAESPDSGPPLTLRQLPGLSAADDLRLGAGIQTVAKPGSELLLLTSSGDPLLAWWRLGQGVAVAVAAQPPRATAPPSDLDREFWGRIARHAQRSQLARPRSWIAPEQGATRVLVDSLESDGALRYPREGAAQVAGPAGMSTTAPLALEGPGRLGGLFDSSALGQYELTTVVGDSAHGRPSRIGFVRDYADEFRLDLSGPQLLREIALASGGRYDPAVDALLSSDGATAVVAAPLWPGLVMAAMCLLVADAWRSRLGFRFRRGTI